MSDGKITIDIPPSWMSQLWVVLSEGPLDYWDEEDRRRGLDLTWGQAAEGFQRVFERAFASTDETICRGVIETLMTGTVDHDVVDTVAQLAIFGELRYG